MLPIKRRVKKESFPEVVRKGVFVHSPHFYLQFIANNDNLPTLLGLVVPNKVKKTSVGRHLIKRRMSAVVEQQVTKMKNGFLLVIFAKKDVSTLPHKETEKEILELLNKAKILS